jgi:RNA polymerase sigma-70 factor (ECF subfamily)
MKCKKICGVSVTVTSDILIRKAKLGDTEAFRTVVENYQNYAFHLAYRFLHCEADAMDIVQESFIRAWRHLPRFNPKNSFTTWLYRIVVNCAFDRLRKKRRKSEVPLDWVPDIIAEDNPESALIRHEDIRRIWNVAERLPQKQRKVFVLRDLQELSIREVAEILRCTEQTVKSHLYYARKKIRQMLAADGDQK